MQLVVTKMRQMAFDAKLPMEQFVAMENLIQTTTRSSGDAIRIKFQALPHGVSLISLGFVQVSCRAGAANTSVWIDCLAAA